MPCNDITDILKILLDSSDRVLKYTLIKKSCGKRVGGRSLIINWLKGSRAKDVINASAGTFLDAHKVTDPIEEFLILKHFLAVKEGLSILLGEKAGGVNNYCTVDTIRYGPNGIEIIAFIKSEMMTDQIKACAQCGCAPN